MKKIYVNLCVPALIIIAGFVSCEKNREYSLNQSDKVKKILEMEARMNALNSGTGRMTGFMSVIGYSQYRNGSLKISGSDSLNSGYDSAVVDTTNFWKPVTCARVTDTTNADGTHTTIYDYGDGCNEYGTLTKGKITYVWKNENSDYYSEVIYDHYYSYGVEMNGMSKYTFTSDGYSYYRMTSGSVISDSVVTIMPVFNWSGTSTGYDDITMKFDDGNITHFKSDFKNVWDSISFKVIRGEYYYSDKSDGYEYHYIVKEALITDYTCGDTWVPVSGVESITTTREGITEEYSLDYGNGTCDNLALLTENGKTSVIDFGELYRIIEPQKGSVRSVLPRGRMK